MKLVSCHVSSFGNLHDKDFDFSSPIISFCEENGFGKSTLACFLKVMFFGMDTVRAGGKEFSDRQHYCPFSGGLFGGNVVFEYKGDTYKIERTFDNVSATKDTMKLFQNGKELSLSKDVNIGARLFDLDKESFERTVFVTSEDIEISSTESINNKMNNFAGSTDPKHSLESALKILDKKFKAQNNEKDAAHKRCLELDKKLEDLKTIQKALPPKYEKLDALNKTILLEEEKLEKARSAALILKDYERYEDYLSSAKTRRAEREKISAEYSFGLPEREEARKVLDALHEQKIIEEKEKVSSFNAEDEKILSSLQKKFEKGTPSEEDFIYLERTVEELRRAEFSYGELEIKEKKEKKPFPTKQEIEELLRMEKEYSSLSPTSNSSNLSVSIYQKPDNRKFLIPLFGAILLLVGGLVCLFFSPIIGAVLSVLSIVFLLAVGFLYLNRKTVTSLPVFPQQQMRQSELYAQIQKTLLLYGYDDNNLSVAVYKLKEDAEQYEKTREQLSVLSDSIRKAQSALKEAFSSYGYNEGEFSQRLYMLRRDIMSLVELERRKSYAQDELEERKSKRKYIDGILIDFFEKYRISAENAENTLNTLLSDIEKIQRLKQEEDYFSESAKNLAKERNLTKKPTVSVEDISVLGENLHALQEEKNLLYSKIREDEEQAEQISEYENEREEKEEREKVCEEKCRLYENTKRYLIEADGRIKDKYIRPVKDTFLKYAALLEKTLGEKTVMNGNFEIRFEREGIERSEKHLSEGQKAIVMLCFRLALIENMYKEDLPFLIFDDPFVHLDKNHLQKVRDLLEKLSDQFQILYFTCHESRKM